MEIEANHGYLITNMYLLGKMPEKDINMTGKVQVVKKAVLTVQMFRSNWNIQ